MNEYTVDQTLRVAKRFHNTKRTYLLVNPLQAKHIPVSPAQSLTMMGALGEKLALKYPAARLVIGFAETATAIGAVVAEAFGEACVYIHTTRENLETVNQWILFREEHSHATEQKLAADELDQWIDATQEVLFVDDELTTGKTLLNIINQMKESHPRLNSKRIVAASILNRLSEDNRKKLEQQGITCEYLVKLPNDDYAARVADFQIREAEPSVPAILQGQFQPMELEAHDPRKGVPIGVYKCGCEEAARNFANSYFGEGDFLGKTLVLGTEECMYPALKVAQVLEATDRCESVCCHATTRSPIGLCGSPDYPIRSGKKLHSFYQKDRDTYIYNLCSYDTVIVVSDTASEDLEGIKSLIGALPSAHQAQICYIQWGRGIWRITMSR